MKQIFAITLTTLLLLSATAQAQFGPRVPNYKSVEQTEEKKLIFRIHAPNAEEVSLGSSDIPGLGQGAKMKRDNEGIWEIEVGPVPAGSYRYNFTVDGLRILDPKNTNDSESNTQSWSLAQVTGSDLFDTQDVPLGAVAEITYHSKSLHTFRRLHVYTPPGYESGSASYPVFYLLHGASDSDDSWSTVGRAGVILDNLIAAGKAQPMIVVMPNGHTGAFSFRGGGKPFQVQMQEFVTDFHEEITPLIEKRYRVKEGRANRAIAGLSMGGAHTLDIAIPNLKDFAYFGVFSSGVFGINQSSDWVDKNKKHLKDESAKEGLELVWFATGKDDFLIETSKLTVKTLEDNGFDVTWKETEGGHTWLNWRDYLAEFAPLLFQ